MEAQVNQDSIVVYFISHFDNIFNINSILEIVIYLFFVWLEELPTNKQTNLACVSDAYSCYKIVTCGKLGF